MTFTDIVNEVADRVNLTTPQAIARIGRSVNERIRWVSSLLELQSITLTTVTTNTVIGVRSVTFPGVNKLYSVFNTTPVPAVRLAELPFDFLKNQPIAVDPPTQFSVIDMGASTVTIFLNTIPASAFPLAADSNTNLINLSGQQIPPFTEDYHDLLVYGAMATELEKMEKYDMAKVQEGRFQSRLAELKKYVLG